MNTCGTCKYFGEVVRDLVPHEDYEPLPDKAKYHVCELIKHTHTTMFSDSTSLEQPDAAVVIDGSNYLAVFCVSEEFGCNKWEPRS